MSGHGETTEGIDEEIVKKLIELRSYLEKRIQELEEEVEKLKVLLKIVDEVIVTRSFRMAETIPIAQAKHTPPVEKREGIPLKTSFGVLLANMYADDSGIRIVPAEGLAFNINTPPFQAFLISRILEPMRTRDSEAVQRGEITPDRILSYEVAREGDIIKEIVVKNYGDDSRLREIRTAARWTLEKIYEKTYGPS